MSGRLTRADLEDLGCTTTRKATVAGSNERQRASQAAMMETAATSSCAPRHRTRHALRPGTLYIGYGAARVADTGQGGDLSGVIRLSFVSPGSCRLPARRCVLPL